MTDKKTFYVVAAVLCTRHVVTKFWNFIKRSKESKYKGKRETVLVPIVIDSHKMTKCSHQKSFVISINTFCFSLKIFVREGKTDNSIIVIVIAS